jgi:peptidoglycan hydrolase CwlO-like protein
MKSEEQLRSASDEVLVALDKLRELEVEKRSVSPTSPRFHTLAREVEQLADRLANTAEVQADLGEKVAQLHAQVADAAPPIEEMTRDVATILAEWREAERRAMTAVAGSSDETAARADVERLRAEYQRAHRSATQRNGNS